MPLLALSIWPIVSIVLFTKLGPAKGLIWSILIGSLFLPEAYGIDLPGLPPLNKRTTVALGLILGFAITRAQLTPLTGPKDPLAQKVIYGFAGLLLLSSVATVLTNREALQFGPTYLPGLGVRDIISMTMEVCVLLVPYFMAQRILTDAHSQTLVLKSILLIGLGYALLVLFEARMSPQLHIWIYGYFQHSWLQHIRGGAFRPIVFLQHGLWVGALMMTCAMVAFILLKERLAQAQTYKRYLVAGLWLAGVLLISRNFGATALALIFVPVLWITGPRIQILCASIVIMTFLSFPILRQTGVITFDTTLSMVSRISEERARSMGFRVENEDAFLERFAAKPLTGWGGWGRGRVYDIRTGEDISISDGAWIIVLGERGWLGFIGLFGLVGAPAILLWRRRTGQPIPPQASGIAIILAATLIYQVPNYTIGSLIMMLAGTLAGYSIYFSKSTQEDAAPQETTRKLVYSRFPIAPDTPDAPAPLTRSAPAPAAPSARAEAPPHFRKVRAAQPRNALLTRRKHPIS